ncbi:LADA_0C02542g1_1 [Lachancea dasiensis]|uniref:LADA_0C02542g1_1 n=1 Tax=Lachancea dasiensis TaxID=1072105 RepID=A0A1G4IXY1_9SACH|nr:LADA_0C02542g1_1 [Lachancea dasiensis]
MGSVNPSSTSDYGRRTWNREEYAQLEQETRHRHESKFTHLSTEQLKILKAKYTNHSNLIKTATQDGNRRTLTTSLSIYKRGKQFGFYCELCDLTFKDTLQFVDHLNHKAHEIKFERTFGEPLIVDLRDNDDVPFDEFDEECSATIREFLKSHGKLPSSKPAKAPIKPEAQSYPPKTEEEVSPSSALDSVMGFKGFGSTKR